MMFEGKPDPDWEYADIWELFQEVSQGLQNIEDCLKGERAKSQNPLTNAAIIIKVSELLNLLGSLGSRAGLDPDSEKPN